MLDKTNRYLNVKRKYGTNGFYFNQKNKKKSLYEDSDVFSKYLQKYNKFI